MLEHYNDIEMIERRADRDAKVFLFVHRYTPEVAVNTQGAQVVNFKPDDGGRWASLDQCEFEASLVRNRMRAKILKAYDDRAAWRARCEQSERRVAILEAQLMAIGQEPKTESPSARGGEL